MNKNKTKLLVLGGTAIVGLAYLFMPHSILAASDSWLPSPENIEPVWQVLETNRDIQNFWKDMMNLVNYFLIAILLVVAFAEILHININTYGFKKMLPSIIFAVIAANLSYFIVRILVDLANVGAAFLITQDTGALTSGLNTVGGADDFKMFYGDGTEPLIALIKLILTFLAGLLIFALAFLLFIRTWIIYFLTVLGPLAFIATILPQTKGIFNQWWSNLLKWTFMPLTSLVWIRLGAEWGNILTGDASGGWVMKYVFAGVCFYMALTTPFKMGGQVMGAWGNWGKKAWNKTGGAAWNATGGALYTAGKNGVNNWYKNTKEEAKEKYVRSHPLYKKHVEDRAARGQYRSQQLESIRKKRSEDAQKKVYMEHYKPLLAKERIANRFKELEEAERTGAISTAEQAELDALRSRGSDYYKMSEWEGLELSRIRAKNRGFIGGERENFQGLKPEDIIKRLEKLGFLDGGKLKSEADLADLSPSDYYEGKAALDVLKRQRTQTKYGTDAEARWQALFTSPTAADEATRRDIAGPLYGTGAVGNSEDEAGKPLVAPPPSLHQAQKQLTDAVDSSTAQAAMQAAREGKTVASFLADHQELQEAFDDPTNPTRKALTEYFGGVQEVRQGVLGDKQETDAMQAAKDEVATGKIFVTQYLSSKGVDSSDGVPQEELDQLKSKVSQSLTSLGSAGVNWDSEAAKPALDVLEKIGFKGLIERSFESDQERIAEAKKVLSHVQGFMQEVDRQALDDIDANGGYMEPGQSRYQRRIL